MGGAGDLPGNDPMDLLQLFHEVLPGMEPPGGINEKALNLPGAGGMACVKDDSSRIGSCLVGDHICLDPPAPDLQLLDGRGAEGVSGS